MNNLNLIKCLKIKPNCICFKGLKLQFFLIFTVILISLSESMYAGWSSAMVNELTSNSSTKLSLNEASLIGTLPMYSSLVMVPFMPYSNNIFGRKWTLLGSSIILLVTWICLLISTNMKWIFAMITLRGLSYLGIYASSVVYLSEIVQANIRGCAVNFISFSVDIAILLSFACTAYMPLQSLTIIASGTAGLMVCLFITAPKTPYFLIMKNKEEEARELLQTLRGSKPSQAELDEIKEAIEMEMGQSGSFWALLKDQKNRKLLLIVICAEMFQQLGGIEAVILYIHLILDNADNNASVYFGVTKLISGVLTLFLIDKVGRRPLVICSSLLTSLWLALLGTYFYSKEVLNYNLTALSWIPLTLLLLYTFFFNLGLGPMAYIIPGEILPTRFRALSASIAILTYTVFKVIVLQVFAVLKDAYGFYLGFWVLAVATAIGFIYCCVFMIETKGKTLSTIQLEQK